MDTGTVIYSEVLDGYLCHDCLTQRPERSAALELSEFAHTDAHVHEYPKIYGAPLRCQYCDREMS